MSQADDNNVAKETGLLAVGDGHHVYWETWGNRDGKPAVYLHGGPGSGFAASALRYFDPGAYRIVLFDQRGAGRSTPHAGAPATDLSTNTTAHLLADIEHLRDHLAEGELLRNLDRLADVSAVLVHGRLDIGSPPITAWTVSQAWPGSRLVLVDEAGHGSGHAEMLRHIRAATDLFAAV